MRMRVTDVHKPLVAAEDVVEAGNDIWLSKQESFIQNRASGRRIRLKRKGGVFVFSVWIRKEKPKGKKVSISEKTPEVKWLTAFEDTGEAEMKVSDEEAFHRQAFRL